MCRGPATEHARATQAVAENLKPRKKITAPDHLALANLLDTTIPTCSYFRKTSTCPFCLLKIKSKQRSAQFFP